MKYLRRGSRRKGKELKSTGIYFECIVCGCPKGTPEPTHPKCLTLPLAQSPSHTLSQRVTPFTCLHKPETYRSSPSLPPLYSKSCFYLINIFCLRFLVPVEQHLCSSKSEFSITNGALLRPLPPPPSPLLPIVSERIEKMLDVGSF